MDDSAVGDSAVDDSAVGHGVAVSGVVPAPSSPRPLVVLVVSYRSAELLRRCLQSLRRYLPDSEVLVWDNHSEASTAVRELATEHPDISWTFAERNVGFAAAVNALAAQRPGADLFLLNPDAELTGPLTRTRAALALPDSAVVSPTLVSTAGRGAPWDVAHRRQSVLRALVSHAGYSERLRGTPVSDLYRRPRFDQRHCLAVDGYLTGCALLVDRVAWDSVGGFDERFYVYAEEADLQRRLLSQGWTVRLVDESHVRHVAHGTAAGDAVATQRSTDLLRNHQALFLGMHGNAGPGTRFLAGLAVLDRVQRSARRARSAARLPSTAPAQVVLTTNELVRGGAERQRVQLAGELAERGHAVTLVCLQGLGPLLSEVDPRVRVVLNPWWQPLPPGIGLGTHPSVVITDITNTEIGFGLLLTRRRGARRPGWLAASHFPPAPAGPTYSAALARAARQADGLVALSPAHLTELSRYQHLPLPAYLVPNGVPERAHRPRPPRRQPLRLGMLSRLVEHKNPHRLVEALLPLAELDWTLDIFGDGPDRARLQQLTPAALTDRVRWRGWSPGPDDAFPELDVLCVPSETEAFPLVIVEAMAAGVPVVAAGVCSVPDMLDHGRAGVVVPPGSLAAWTSALHDVITDPDRLDALAQAARERQRTRYSISAMADGYQAAIADVLARRYPPDSGAQP